MRKLNLFLIWMLMLAVTITGAMALENMSKWGVNDQNMFWMGGQKGTAPYIVNWSDLGQSNNMPLVYDLNGDGVNEIIQNRNGTILIYNLSGSLIASQYFVSGLGNRQMSAFDAQSCPNGKGLYILKDNGWLDVLCLNGSSITSGWTCNPAVGASLTTPDYTGASVSKQGGHNLAVYYFWRNYWTTSFVAWCDETTSIGGYSFLPTYSQTYYGVPPHGNLLGDGKEYWVFPYYNPDSSTMGVTYINMSGSMNTIAPITTGAPQNLIKRTPMVVKRGGGHIDELLIPYTKQSYVPLPLDVFWYGDASGYTYANFQLGSDGDDYSNAVQLGTSGDICWAYDVATYHGWYQPTDWANSFICITPSTLATSYQQSIDSLYNGLTTMDMNNDGYADFFFSDGSGVARLCLYTNNSNPLNCTSLGGTADYIYGVDVDNDGYRDIVYSDSSTDMFRVWLTQTSCGYRAEGEICSEIDPCVCGLHCTFDPAWNNSVCTQSFCTDTDLAVFPTINYTLSGTANATNSYNYSTTHTDCCWNYGSSICTNSSTSYLKEYYCNAFDDSGLTSGVYNCGTIGDICQGGACVPPNLTTSCNDTDRAVYPTINYTLRGTMSATNITNRTDYCNLNNVTEFYCDNSSSYHPVPVSYDCTIYGNVCVNGSCVAVASNGTCDDSDSLIYPTINYNLTGVVTTNNGTELSYTDFCYAGDHLLEYYCGSPTIPLVTNTSYWCGSVGKICEIGTGQCVLNTTGDSCGTMYEGEICTNTSLCRCNLTCSYNPSFNNSECISTPAGCSVYTDPVAYPTLWLETFGYTDSITNHGWSGYPFVVGNNPYGTCNELLYNVDNYSGWITHTLNSPVSGTFELKWDMQLESSLGNNTYEPNGVSAQVEMFDSDSGDVPIHLYWTFDGTIFWADENATRHIIGNWQGTPDSYKIIVNLTNKSYDFYYTNQTNLFSYVQGCSHCPLGANVSQVDSFEWKAQSVPPEIHLIYGMWLDNIRLTQGVEQPPIENMTNFCYFTGCIFHDHFTYADDTYTHGWYMFNTTPSQSIVFYGNSTDGYYFDHTFNTFRSTDGTGIISMQFKAKFPQPPESALDLIHFYLYADDYLIHPIDIEFTDGLILDPNRGGASLGTYGYNTWITYTIVANIKDNYYDLYANSNRLGYHLPITATTTAVSKVGFWVNTNSSIDLDYVTIAQGTLLADSLVTGGTTDTGVPAEHLRNCWGTNGSFDWSCCEPDEISDKSMWCPTRVTGLNILANITTFALTYFLYFIIIIIILVILIPFFIKARGG